MANWASVSYRIEGSKDDLKRLLDVIDGFVKGKVQPVTKGADATWEGNILKVLGATDEQINNNYLRGFIGEYELDGDSVRIEAEEAWGATDFRHLLKKIMPELTVYFIVEEPGCEVYATNDADGKYFTERFYVDSFVDGDYWSDCFSTEETAMKYVAELLKKDEVTEDDIENFNREHEGDDEYISLHEYKIVG